MNRAQAFPQLGLPPTATADQIRQAYEAALAELNLMERNARSESLTDAYRRARLEIDSAYRVLSEPEQASQPAGADGGGQVALAGAPGGDDPETPARPRRSAFPRRTRSP